MGNLVHPDSKASSAMPLERLDGWKSIAAYLKRDRTTVMRWTRERGLPVHRLPGGRTGTVFALRHELDLWAGLSAMPGDDVLTFPLPSSFARPGTGPDQPRSGAGKAAQGTARRLAVWAMVGLTGAMAAAVAIRSGASAEPSGPRISIPALPRDPAMSSKFLTARDLIADRRSAGLERAIDLLEQVVRSAPDYALGHASLAEALILSREFGMRSDAEAFAAARVAARTAVRLVPDLAAGHRLLGFIAYWADRDFAEADAQFQRALIQSPNDAISHFWYGNILSDHGDHRAGIHALDRARLLQPGSVAIRTDLAWAQWSAGQDEAATKALNAIIATYPDFAVAHDCLSIISLARGDYAGYARHFLRFAELKRDTRLIGNAHAVDAAVRDGNGPQVILRQALDEAAHNPSASMLWPALIASAGQDAAQLRRIVRVAGQRDQRPGDAGLKLHIRHAWRHDPAVSALLTTL